MNGMDAIRRLRLHAHPQVTAIPIIALAALAMRGDRERCLRAGANGYLTKPARLPDLLQLIHRFSQEQPSARIPRSPWVWQPCFTR